MKSKRLAGQIRDATEAVDDKMKQMQSVLDAMDGAGRADGQLSELGQCSRQVRKAAEVISTLAWQSHLLALNASIEAARAGAAGQNFSAVALEVKDLSGRTAQAAGDVRGQLEAIQGDGGQAVAGIREIAGMVQRIDSISGTISAAVKTQVSATGEMGRNLAAAAERTRAIVSHAADVAAAAQTTTEVAGETERAAAGLSEMADRLNALVGSFRL